MGLKDDLTPPGAEPRGWPVEETPRSVFTTRLEKMVNWARAGSLWPLPFGTACCAIEFMSVVSAHYDLARFGAEVVRFSPRQSDMMIVAGTVVDKQAPILKLIYEQSVEELSESLSPDLRDELAGLVPPFSSPTPSDAELRVAQAQLVGWLEGLFHGIQATLFAQQMAARQQLEQMRGQLPPGAQPGPEAPDLRPGTYL